MFRSVRYHSKSFDLTEEVWNEYSPIVTQFIEELEASTRGEDSLFYEGPQLDLTNTKMNPYRLWKMLERMGYKKTDFQSNGWEFDFWIYFKKDGHKTLLVWGTGITFNLWLRESDK